MEAVIEKILTQKNDRIAGSGFDYGEHIPRHRLFPVVKPSMNSGMLICEIKRQSPSEGIIKENMDIAKTVLEYVKNGADAISVLTERDNFGGSLADLIEVKSKLPGIPVLRKDFLIHPEEIEVSYRAGADMVLLVASIFMCMENGREILKKMYSESISLGMTPLVEIHREEEYEFVEFLKPVLIGINSRNLGDFTIDRCLPHALIEKNGHTNVLFESGIRNYTDAFFAGVSGFCGILAGTSVMKDEDIASKVSELSEGFRNGRKKTSDFYRKLMNKIYGKKKLVVKICGITNIRDLMEVADNECDMAGFILAESRRKIDMGKLRELSDNTPGRILKVGVITVLEIEMGLNALKNGFVDVLQLHGKKTEIEGFGLKNMDGCWYRAYNVGNLHDLEFDITPFELYDAFVEGSYGGNGKMLSQVLAKRIMEKKRVYGMAGGINADNVAEIVRKFSPSVIDICSGLESEPGFKDSRKIKEFFSQLRR